MKQLLQEFEEQGNKLILIPVKRLQNLKDELNSFKEEEELNGFQRWIVNELYHFDLPEAGFEIRSILLVALSHPAHAEVELNYQGTIHKTLSLVKPDFDIAGNRITQYLTDQGYHCCHSTNLPLKRLAVQSGFAVYGKNNITYIDGLGSYFSYDAFFTDLPCSEGQWRPVTIAASCISCSACIHHCPTQAIRKDRYLIDNQRCLSAINEMPGEFPDWLAPSIHHTMYDCLRCQEICPMNQEYRENVLRTVVFNEEETGMLLSGAPYDSFSDSMKRRTKLLGLDDWLEAIPRNLRMLLEKK